MNSVDLNPVDLNPVASNSAGLNAVGSKPDRLLIIDNDKALSDQLAEWLQGCDYQVTQCLDGESGLMSALQHPFDLILLSATLPVTDGMSVLKQLRHLKQTPVMMLTVQGTEAERIESYQQGADDCLLKPFSFTELKLRIEAVLRRTRQRLAESFQEDRLIIDDLYLNKTTQEVTYRSMAVVLTPVQFRLLWILAACRYNVLSKPYLYQAVLERQFNRYDRSLDMHLSRIRRKLEHVGLSAERLITVHGKGYRFA